MQVVEIPTRKESFLASSNFPKDFSLPFSVAQRSEIRVIIGVRGDDGGAALAAFNLNEPTPDTSPFAVEVTAFLYKNFKTEGAYNNVSVRVHKKTNFTYSDESYWIIFTRDLPFENSLNFFPNRDNTLEITLAIDKLTRMVQDLSARNEELSLKVNPVNRGVRAPGVSRNTKLNLEGIHNNKTVVTHIETDNAGTATFKGVEVEGGTATGDVIHDDTLTGTGRVANPLKVTTPLTAAEKTKIANSLSEVTSDDTLTGEGTASSPLSVAEGGGGGGAFLVERFSSEVKSTAPTPGQVAFLTANSVYLNVNDDPDSTQIKQIQFNATQAADPSLKAANPNNPLDKAIGKILSKVEAGTLIFLQRFATGDSTLTDVSMVFKATGSMNNLGRIPVQAITEYPGAVASNAKDFQVTIVASGDHPVSVSQIFQPGKMASAALEESEIGSTTKFAAISGAVFKYITMAHLERHFSPTSLHDEAIPFTFKTVITPNVGQVVWTNVNQVTIKPRPGDDTTVFESYVKAGHIFLMQSSTATLSFVISSVTVGAGVYYIQLYPVFQHPSLRYVDGNFSDGDKVTVILSTGFLKLPITGIRRGAMLVRDQHNTNFEYTPAPAETAYKLERFVEYDLPFRYNGKSATVPERPLWFREELQELFTRGIVMADPTSDQSAYNYLVSVRVGGVTRRNFGAVDYINIYGIESQNKMLAIYKSGSNNFIQRMDGWGSTLHPAFNMNNTEAKFIVRGRGLSAISKVFVIKKNGITNNADLPAWSFADNVPSLDNTETITLYGKGFPSQEITAACDAEDGVGIYLALKGNTGANNDDKIYYFNLTTEAREQDKDISITGQVSSYITAMTIRKNSLPKGNSAEKALQDGTFYMYLVTNDYEQARAFKAVRNDDYGKSLVVGKDKKFVIDPAPAYRIPPSQLGPCARRLPAMRFNYPFEIGATDLGNIIAPDRSAAIFYGPSGWHRYQAFPPYRLVDTGSSFGTNFTATGQGFYYNKQFYIPGKLSTDVNTRKRLRRFDVANMAFKAAEDIILDIGVNQDVRIAQISPNIKTSTEKMFIRYGLGGNTLNNYPLTGAWASTENIQLPGVPDIYSFYVDKNRFLWVCAGAQANLKDIKAYYWTGSAFASVADLYEGYEIRDLAIPGSKVLGYSPTNAVTSPMLSGVLNDDGSEVLYYTQRGWNYVKQAMLYGHPLGGLGLGINESGKIVPIQI